jgi:hypothetical protein
MKDIFQEPNIQEIILEEFLREINRDNRVDPAEKQIFNLIYAGLSISREKFDELKKHVRDTSPKAEKNNSFSHKRLFQTLKERLSPYCQQEAQCKQILIRIKQIIHWDDSDASSFIDSMFSKTSSPEKQNRSIKDPECLSLLKEIAAKDWKTELEDFRSSLLWMKADDMVSEVFKSLQESELKTSAIIGGIIGAILSLFVGPGGAMFMSLIAGFFLAFALILFFGSWSVSGSSSVAVALSVIVITPLSAVSLSSLPGIIGTLIHYILPMFFGAVIGAGTAGGFWVKWKRYKLEQQREQFRDKEIDKLDNYIMLPEDLLRFWESRIETFIRDRQIIINRKLKELSSTMAECKKTAGELREYKDSEHTKSASALETRAREINETIKDAKHVSILLQKLENHFACKIEELKSMIHARREYERKIERKEILSKKASSLLGQSKKSIEDWHKSKEEMQIQLAGMVDAFQYELSAAKDYIHAEIELSEDSSIPVPEMLKQKN